MKQFIVSLFLLFSLSISAEGTPNQPATGGQKIHLAIGSIQEQILRAPARITLEATYYELTNTIIIVSQGSYEGEVFLYNAFGELEDYSNDINAILNVTSSGAHTLVVQFNGWVAEGEFETL